MEALPFTMSPACVDVDVDKHPGRSLAIPVWDNLHRAGLATQGT
jgi:hypothetical protein